MLAHKVEDEDDIKNVPASISKESEVSGKTSTNQDVKTGESVQETSSANKNTADLPPHIFIDMPALSPTMVTMKLFEFFSSYKISLLISVLFLSPMLSFSSFSM